MSSFAGDNEFSIQEIKDIFLNEQMGQLIHSELVYTLTTKENKLVQAETQELVSENYRLGGSPIGYFYQGELFAIEATFGKEGLEPIHTSLEDKAAHLKANRMDIPQYATYFAHFLAYLGQLTNNPTEYVANMPEGISRFSKSLSTLKSFIELHDKENIEKYQYSREDPTKQVYFLHLDRINTPLNRFLFRRITS